MLVKKSQTKMGTKGGELRRMGGLEVECLLGYLAPYILMFWGPVMDQENQARIMCSR